MDIDLPKKLNNILQERKALVRKYGPKRAKQIRRRMLILSNAKNLMALQANSLKFLHCHQLTGKRKSQFAINADAKLRIIFEVANEPIPTLEDHGFDLKNITHIKVLEIEDYHG